MTKLNERGKNLLELYEAYSNASTPKSVRNAINTEMQKLSNAEVRQAISDEVSVKRFGEILRSHYVFIEYKFDEKDFVVDILKDFGVPLEINKNVSLMNTSISVERHVMCRLTDIERIFKVSKSMAKSWFHSGTTQTIVKNLYRDICQKYIDEYRAVLPEGTITSTKYGENIGREMCYMTIGCNIKSENLSVENIKKIGRFMQQMTDISLEIQL